MSLTVGPGAQALSATAGLAPVVPERLLLRAQLLMRMLASRGIPAAVEREDPDQVLLAWPVAGGEACIHLAQLGVIECCISVAPGGTVTRYLAATIPETAAWAERVGR